MKTHLLQLCFLSGLRVSVHLVYRELVKNRLPAVCKHMLNFLYENTYVSLTSSHSLLEERIRNFTQTVKLGWILGILSHLWFRIISF